MSGLSTLVILVFIQFLTNHTAFLSTFPSRKSSWHFPSVHCLLFMLHCPTNSLWFPLPLQHWQLWPSLECIASMSSILGTMWQLFIWWYSCWRTKIFFLPFTHQITQRLSTTSDLQWKIRSLATTPSGLASKFSSTELRNVTCPSLLELGHRFYITGLLEQSNYTVEMLRNQCGNNQIII